MIFIYLPLPCFCKEMAFLNVDKMESVSSSSSTPFLTLFHALSHSPSLLVPSKRLCNSCHKYHHESFYLKSPCLMISLFFVPPIIVFLLRYHLVTCTSTFFLFSLSGIDEDAFFYQLDYQRLKHQTLPWFFFFPYTKYLYWLLLRISGFLFSLSFHLCTLDPNIHEGSANPYIELKEWVNWEKGGEGETKSWDSRSGLESATNLLLPDKDNFWRTSKHSLPPLSSRSSSFLLHSRWPSIFPPQIFCLLS